MKLVFVAIALGGFAAPVGAVAGSTPMKASLDEADAEKVVCKTRKKTGSRLGTKTCRTVRQWDAIAETNRRALKEVVDRPQVAVCGPNGCD